MKILTTLNIFYSNKIGRQHFFIDNKKKERKKFKYLICTYIIKIREYFTFVTLVF